MFNNPYLSTYNPQVSIDRINNQIAELEKMKSQIPQAPISQNQPAINQTFQLAPNNQSSGMKYVNSMDDVSKELVFGDTPFFSKDLSVLWIKNAKGEIKSYELKEIIQKDEKDLQIEFLMAQIKELKEGMTLNAKPSFTNVDGADENEKSSVIPNGKPSKTKSK